MTHTNSQMTDSTDLPGTDALSKSVWHPKDWTAALALFAATFGFYAQTLRFQFIDYDDPVYVYRNVHITTGLTLPNLHSAVTAMVNGNWHPLTTLTWLLLASLSGTSPGAFHFANVVLHASSACLFFVFLRRATGRMGSSFFASALWALHPLRAESVAWVSELKDTLCGVMWLGCLISYSWYSSRRSAWRYLWVVGFLILALLAKPVAVTLPFVLVLLDYWPLSGGPREKWSSPGLVRVVEKLPEKLPLLLLVIADIAAEIHSQRLSHLMTSPVIYPLSIRIENAFISAVAYLRDVVYPAHLIAFYPHPAILTGGHLSPLAASAACAVLLVISLLVCLPGRSKPYLFVGWFWFLGTLVPNLGIIQSGDQARADRFTYFPTMGLTVAVVWLLAEVTQSTRAWRYAAGLTAGAVCVVMAVVTFQDVGYWQDSITWANHILEVDPDNFIALATKGDVAENAGQIDQALSFYAHAVSVAPRRLASRVGYAYALRSAGRYPDAIAQLTEVLSHDPWSGDAWDVLGTIRERQARDALGTPDAARSQELGRLAVRAFRNALAVSPDMAEAAEHLALELAAEGNLDEAVAVWKALVIKFPTYGQAQGDLADALRLQNDLAGAVEHYRAALAAGSKNPSWESELAYLMATSSLATPAEVMPLVAVAKDAVDQTDGRDAAAQDAYAACLARTNQFELAINAAQQGIAAANAAHQPGVAAGIQRRLALYEKYQPYVAGPSQPGSTSAPATSP